MTAKGRRRKTRELYERDFMTCHICLLPVPWNLDPQHPRAPSADHVIPQCEGGTRGPYGANLKLAHRWCNSHRHGLDVESIDRDEFRRRLCEAGLDFEARMQ
jgi:hypothetical protein